MNVFKGSERVTKFFDRPIFRIAFILGFLWVMWIIVFSETQSDYTKDTVETVEAMGLLSRALKHPSSVPSVLVKKSNGNNVTCRFPNNEYWQVGDYMVATKWVSKKGKIKYTCAPLKEKPTP